MRYALYYIPEQQSPLALLGASLLGWDIYGAEPNSTQAIMAGFEKIGFAISPQRLESMTQEARRYGLHATLKAPFYLAEGCHEEQLLQAVDAFASTQAAFTLPPLHVKRIGNFLALALMAHTEQESENMQKTHNFAAQCLQHFESFRRAPSADELARRRQKKLSSRQEEYLLRFGYPYVLEDFRFHMTLCHLPLGQDAKGENWNASLQHALAQIFSPFLQGNKVMTLHLCRSDDAGRFSLFHKAALQG